MRANYPALDLAREITGSLEFIRGLAPAAKPRRSCFGPGTACRRPLP
ncbi:MAG: hypothetical protein R3F11_12380 [Verrucomicrobiales bacterium]